MTSPKGKLDGYYRINQQRKFFHMIRCEAFRNGLPYSMLRGIWMCMSGKRKRKKNMSKKLSLKLNPFLTIAIH